MALLRAVSMAIVMVTTTATSTHAQSEDDTIAAAATEAGVNPQALRGAMSSTGQDAYSYLRSVNELPVQQKAPVVSAPPGGIWAQLAQCESTGNWHASTGNGYSGGLQMDATFWKNYGGLQYASAAYLATPAQQVLVAQRGLAVQGPSAWPICSKRVGLTR